MKRLCLALVFAGATAAHADVPDVVTDTPVVHSLVAQVMGDLGQPTLLLDRGGDPHSFQLRPSQAAALGDADIVFWIGPALTPWLDRALEASSRARTVALLDVEGTHTREYTNDEEHEMHAEDTNAAGSEAGHSHADEDGHDHGHVHEGIDPHAWLDPANARVWLAAIALTLGELDPENSAAYAANADRASREIEALDSTLADRFDGIRGVPFAVFHEAYGSLAEHYGLSIAGSIAEGDAADPGAAHGAELRNTLSGAACLFPEAGHDIGMAEALASDTGLKLGAPLDPEGRSLEPGPALYAALLTGLADAILDCVAAP